MTEWFKIYQWIKYSIFLGFGTFMIIEIINDKFYEYVHSKPVYAEGIAMLLFALLTCILLSVSVVFFINKFAERKKPKLEKVE